VRADPKSMSVTNVRIAIAKDICLQNVQYRFDASHFTANITVFLSSSLQKFAAVGVQILGTKNLNKGVYLFFQDACKRAYFYVIYAFYSIKAQQFLFCHLSDYISPIPGFQCLPEIWLI
jgi:hypothetical protein